MSTIVTRAGKGSALTHNEVDANFVNLNTDKIEAAQSVTLTNKTISGSNNTLSNIGNSSLTNSSVTLGSTSVSLGSTVTSVSGLTLSSPTVNTPTLSGGTINNASVGATTPSSGAFTTLSATGVTTVQAGTAAAPAITTSGDTNTGIFFPAADTIAFTEGGVESARFDSSGNFLINATTNSLSAKVKIATATRTANFFDLTATGGENWVINSTNTTGSTDVLGIYANGTTGWYLRDDGNVGVGTSSPASKLHVTGLMRICDASAYLLFRNAADSTSNGVIQFPDSGAASIQQYRNEALYFATNNNERMRITSGGNLCVGTTTEAGRAYILGDGTNVAFRVAANTATTTVYASIMRHESTTSGAYIQFVTDGNVETGRIYDSAGTMQYASSSDARLKTNVQPMQNSLQSVLALNPCTFDMRRGEDTFVPSAGLIAQEVHEIYPFVVGVGGDDENTNPWSVDYGKLTPLLVAAIKELNAKVEAQAAEIAALKGNA